MEGTAALRGAAARWTLAGDQQLLDLLQEIHQRIIVRCTETNQRLEEMSRGLRDASVNLQNVNNKFLALSNTQFVESRVYEDDADVTPPLTDKEPPKPKDLASDLTKLKESLNILESFHEPLLIVRDSDSDSDSDDDNDRLVLKPKDLYTDRPLPYIIGSQAWKSKWHAGLVPDESDSDSSTSKVEEVEQYSDSEEDTPAAQDYLPARKVSTGSSSLQSEAPVSVSPVRPSPAAVAAELARRLGGDIKVPEREPLYTPPEAVPRKLYKPQEPLATTIFPDEPPPLDEQSSDEDIFAELHKSQPKLNSNRVDDLFDFNVKPSGLEEALFGPHKPQTNQTIEKSPLFQDSGAEIVPETPRPREQPEDSVKKPVGGISLFGTKKNSESIGAAILKRNRRKSTSSDDESNTEEVKEVKPVKVVKEIEPKEVPEVKDEVRKERDIFDDLFAKSEKLNKKNVKDVKKDVVQPKSVVPPKEAKKNDIFSDIFDDIDDIFSSDIVNVQVKPANRNEKPLFEDDDDLFADVSKAKIDHEIGSVSGNPKSDLFSNVVPKVDKVKSNDQSDLFVDNVTKLTTNEVKKENKVIKEIKETKSIFDSDSDDGLFTNVAQHLKQSKNVKTVEPKLKDDLFGVDDDDDGLFATNNTKSKVEVTTKIGQVTELSKKALFDSDDELFKETKNITDSKSKIRKTSVADTTEDDDKSLVTRIHETNKPDIISAVNTGNDELLNAKQVRKEPTVIDSINSTDNDFNDDIPPIESQEKATPKPSHDSFDDEESNVIKSTVIGNKTTENTGFSKYTDNQDNRETISDHIFSKPEQTHFKENILRTTRIASAEVTIEKTRSPDVFNDSDDNFFRSQPKPKIPSKSENIVQKDTSKPIDEPQSQGLYSKPPDNNVFSDIFDDVPPVFEKPKEPKKSKNINALFDDDSDDEALFFKKNDVINDEKPDFSPSEERFGIFNDEPPAIDVDFIQKSSKQEGFLASPKSDDVLSAFDTTDSDTSKLEKTDSIEKLAESNSSTVGRESQDATDNLSKEPKKIGKLKPMNININVNSLLPGASPKKKQVESDVLVRSDLSVKEEYAANNEEPIKTDRIEPKIVKSISFDDPELLDNKISKQRAKIQVKRRPSTRRARIEAVRKSAIDFTDSSYDSSNDNSTKDEVKEKIVKTVYILNDDDIFGSTKTEKAESTKKHLNIVDSDEELLKKPELKADNNNDVDTKSDKRDHVPFGIKSPLESDDNDDLFRKSSNIKEMAKNELDSVVNKQNSIEHETETNEINNIKKTDVIKNERSKESGKKSFLDSDDSDDLFRPTSKKTFVPQTTDEPNLDSDEELFRSAPSTAHHNVKETKPQSETVDDLFKTATKNTSMPVSSHLSSDEEDLFKNKGVATLGNVYKKEDTKIKNTHNIFDDFPPASKKIDDLDQDTVLQSKVNLVTEPDKPVKVVEKTKQKSILDDLSDEEDYFKSKPKLLSKKNTSLFGDFDDEEDLFGTRKVKEVKPKIPSAQPAQPVKDTTLKEPVFVKETKTAEPVFVDPLSLFGDED